MIESFLRLASVVDTETTHTDPQQAVIVELAVASYAGRWQVMDSLFGLNGSMPPEASAKNQISNRMLEGLPTFANSVLQSVDMIDLNRPWLVAHNAAYDRTVLAQNWRSAGESELADWVDDPNRWICTWRLSKLAYQHQFTDQLYGQNYLRYKLDLPVPDSVSVHRAGADVQVCAALLERLIKDLIELGSIDPQQPLGPQLVCLTQQPLLLKYWPLGKHRGRLLTELETDYLLWAVDNVPSLNPEGSSFDGDLYESVRLTLESRLA